MQGAQTFHASENGNKVGTPMVSFEDTKGVTLDKMVIISKEEIASRGAKCK
jgi:hypothetical protein